MPNQPQVNLFRVDQWQKAVAGIKLVSPQPALAEWHIRGSESQSNAAWSPVVAQRGLNCSASGKGPSPIISGLAVRHVGGDPAMRLLTIRCQ